MPLERSDVNSNSEDMYSETTITYILGELCKGLVTLLQLQKVVVARGFHTLKGIFVPRNLKRNGDVASHNMRIFTCSNACLPALSGAWIRLKTLCCFSFTLNSFFSDYYVGKSSSNLSCIAANSIVQIVLDTVEMGIQ